MHLEVYRQRPDVQAVVHAHPPTATGFAVAGIPLDRAVLAEVLTTLGSIPIAEYATPSTEELPEAVRKYIKAHDGMLLANHGALTRRRRSVRRVLQDGDDRALREDQPGGAAARRREPARRARKSTRLQGLRGTYGIKAPAPICADPADSADAAGDPATCQVVQAPAGGGQRLVPDRSCRRAGRGGDGLTAEIRLTYRELSALIEDAIAGSMRC